MTFILQAKPFLEKDKAIVKKILKGVQLKRPNGVQSALLRRHFLELTQTFMIPLERYLASLMPLARNISPYRAAPKVKPFLAEDFLRSLDACGPQVKLNSILIRMQQLYYLCRLELILGYGKE